MKKHLISCLMLLICYCELFGQEINSSISVSHLSGTGKINNAWGISMTIDLIPRIDYSASGCISKHYNQIAGKYQYDKQDESIFLIGEQIVWTADKGEMDSLIVFELNSKFERTAQFSGQLNKNNFTGIWKNLKNDKSYPFSIKFNSGKFGNLTVSWRNKTIDLINLKGTFEESDFNLVKQIEKNDSLVIVLETVEPCCGYYNCRGVNCGGTDEYVYLYFLTNNSIEYFKEKISSSCDWEEIKERTIKPDKYLIVTENSHEQQFLVTIDYKNLKLGLKKVKR